MTQDECGDERAVADFVEEARVVGKSGDIVRDQMWLATFGAVFARLAVDAVVKGYDPNRKVDYRLASLIADEAVRTRMLVEPGDD